MRRPEEQIQKSIVKYLEVVKPDCFWFHVPNQRGTRTLIENKILKTLGVKAGVPDLVFILHSGLACFAEVKSSKGPMTPAQKDVRDRLLDLGCSYSLVRSINDMEQSLKVWGLIR
jgi:hypothetical protein